MPVPTKRTAPGPLKVPNRTVGNWYAWRQQANQQNKPGSGSQSISVEGGQFATEFSSEFS